jgi:hypothetical protein
MNAMSEKNTIWIAVPYYCALLMPKRGLSRIYFFVQANIVERLVHYQTMKIWPGQQVGSLAGWLREQGVQGVLSTDVAPKYVLELRQVGIWHWQADASDSDDLISTWFAHIAAEDYGCFRAQQLTGQQGSNSENCHLSTRSNALQ